jgi:lipopolysaccharide transport system permease protein
LIGNANLITKIYFPRLIIPTAAVLAGLIDFAIASILFVPLLLYYHISITWRFLLIVPVSILITTLAMGMGILFSALNARYRDVRYALPFLLQVWMFVSPVIYPSSLVPSEWRWLFVVNPLTGIIESYRASLFGQAIDWWGLGLSLVFTLLLLLLSAYSFRRMERSFAEVI